MKSSYQSRGSFLKYARRQLRRKFGITEGEKIEKITFKERCLAICPFLNKLFPLKQKQCLLCGAVERTDQEPHVKCPTPDCVGLFCIQCFAELQNLCTICRSPIEYGDLSDISEEKDSSEDELIVKKEPVTIVTEIELVIGEKIVERAEMEEIPREKEVKEILKEKVEEKDEVVIVGKKDQAVQTDDEIDESSESIYSYTYQDESPRENEITVCHRRPFKDIEEQKIREDVTIQIFNDSLANESTSSSEDPTSCFIVRARKKLRTELKRKSCSSPCKDVSSSSTSIADTESWPTEEVDEEEVIHIETDDSSKELLLKDNVTKGKKWNSARKIAAALTKIPWLGKTVRKSECKRNEERWPMEKRSIIDRVIRMLPGNQSTSTTVQACRRNRRITKEDTKRRNDSSVSSSSYDETAADERSLLLKTHDRQVDCLQIADHDVSEGNIYSRNYDSHRARRRTVCVNRQSDRYARTDDVNLRYPCEKKFATKQLPRYLQPISRDTAYYEVDEIKDLPSVRRCIRSGDVINPLSDTRISIDSYGMEKWNITSDNYSQNSCSCTSHISNDVKEQNKSYQSDMNAKTKQRDEIFERKRTSEIDKEPLITYWESRSKHGKKSGKTIVAKETLMDAETDRQVILQEPMVESVERKSIGKNGAAGMELSDIVQEKGVKRHSIRDEQFKTMKEPKSLITKVNDQSRANDSLADVNLLYGVTYQVARREKRPVEEKVTKQLRERGATEFERGIEIVQKATQVSAGEIENSAEVPKKNIQTNLQKFRKCKESDGISPIDTKISHKADTAVRERNMIMARREVSTDKRRKRGMRHEDLPGAGGAEWHSGHDVQRPREIAASRPIVVSGLIEDHRTQCNLYDREDIQRKRHRISNSKFRNVPEDWSCNVRPCFKSPERNIDYHDYNYQDQRSSPNTTSRRTGKKHYNVNVRQNTLEIPRLKKYLPAHQTPGLIEELKQHDRVKLIQERETRRWLTLNALRGIKEKPRDQESYDDTYECIDGSTSVSTKLTERNNTLPYQETQTFRDMIHEFRKRVMEASERPLISLSQCADKCKDLKQLYPFKNEDRRVTPTSKFNKVANRFKPSYNKYEKQRDLITEKNRNTQSDSLDEISSTYDYACKVHPSGISTSTDETTDNNDHIP